MTGSSFAASIKRARPLAGSSSQTPPKRSRNRVRSSPSGNGKRLEDGKLQALDVKKGDRILFGKYSGSDIKLTASST